MCHPVEDNETAVRTDVETEARAARRLQHHLFMSICEGPKADAKVLVVVDYRLTDLGMSVLPVLAAMAAWGEANADAFPAVLEVAARAN